MISGWAIGGGFAATLLLLFFRVPVGVVLGGVALAGISLLVGSGGALAMLETIPFNFVAHWTLSVIPMFILMGNVAAKCGLTHDLFDAARAWLSRLPGGLAVASIAGAAGFSCITGSSMACAAAMGKIAVPEMVRRQYDPAFATGTVAAAGLLGSLIPPSVILIIYGLFAEVSIGHLFLAGFLPGILTALLYIVMVVARVRHNPALAPATAEPVTWAQRFATLRGLWPVLAVVFGIVGGLVAGVFTPTEAGAVGAMLTIVILALQRRLSWQALWEAGRETVQITAAIFVIAIGAALLTRFMALSGLPTAISDFVEAQQFTSTQVIIFTALVYLVLGCFLDSIGIMLLTLPVLIPAFEASGVDMIWAGILIAKLLEIGLITPPVGLNVFVIKSVVDDTIALGTIFRGVVWYFVLELGIVSIMITWPEIITWFPSKFYNT